MAESGHLLLRAMPTHVNRNSLNRRLKATKSADMETYHVTGKAPVERHTDGKKSIYE